MRLPACMVTSPVMIAIKNILNVGVLIVLIQASRWANSDLQIMRRGEFYELLLVTLFGMFLMISARHFLLFVIGLEAASLPLAAMVAFDQEALRKPRGRCQVHTHRSVLLGPSS